MILRATLELSTPALSIVAVKMPGTEAGICETKDCGQFLSFACPLSCQALNSVRHNLQLTVARPGICSDAADVTRHTSAQQSVRRYKIYDACTTASKPSCPPHSATQTMYLTYRHIGHFTECPATRTNLRMLLKRQSQSLQAGCAVMANWLSSKMMKLRG